MASKARSHVMAWFAGRSASLKLDGAKSVTCVRKAESNGGDDNGDDNDDDEEGEEEEEEELFARKATHMGNKKSTKISLRQITVMVPPLRFGRWW